MQPSRPCQSYNPWSFDRDLPQTARSRTFPWTGPTPTYLAASATTFGLPHAFALPPPAWVPTAAVFANKIPFAPRSKSQECPAQRAAHLTQENLDKMQGNLPDYSDYSVTSNRIGYALTVDKLKNILRHYSNKFGGTPCRTTGRKAELIDRVRALLTDAKDNGRAERYQELVRVINYPYLAAPNQGSPRPQPLPTPPQASTSALPLPPPVSAPVLATTSYTATAPVPAPIINRYSHLNHLNGTSSATIGAINSSASSSRPPVAATPATSNISSNFKTITWRPSIFYTISRQLCDPVLCPKAIQGDRKSVILSFVLTDAEAAQIRDGRASPKNPQYQVRLFATSEHYYSPPYSSYNSLRVTANAQPQGAAAVEFPTQSEVRVNGTTLSVNLKGSKKKEGGTMPPDMSKPPGTSNVPALNSTAYYTNRIEMIYTNSPEKRYYITACLVLYCPPEECVAKIKARPKRPKEDAIKHVKETNDDPDIVAESFSLSLRCPLTFVRMTMPCKAASCHHLQCFEAGSFLALVEQTPVFSCPVCSRTIDPTTLSIDEFTSTIIDQIPSKYESVIVECDGTWHTDDYRYGTSPVPINFKAPPEEEEKKPVADAGAVEILDSDGDDDYPPFATKSVTARDLMNLGRSPPRPARQTQVIDLTLDSDEEPSAAPPNSNNKRPAPSDGLTMPYPAQRPRF